MKIKPSRAGITPEAKLNYKKQLDDEGCEPLTFSGGSVQDLKGWPGFRADNCTREDQISYVQVLKPNLVQELVPEEKWKNVLQEFEEEKKSKTVSAEMIRELGVKYGILSGKWIVFVASSEAEKLWQKVIVNLVEGNVPDCVQYVRRPSKGPDSLNYATSTKISFYTKNFTDEQDCRKVLLKFIYPLYKDI